MGIRRVRLPKDSLSSSRRAQLIRQDQELKVQDDECDGDFDFHLCKFSACNKVSMG